MQSPPEFPADEHVLNRRGMTAVLAGLGGLLPPPASGASVGTKQRMKRLNARLQKIFPGCKVSVFWPPLLSLWCGAVDAPEAWVPDGRWERVLGGLPAVLPGSLPERTRVSINAGPWAAAFAPLTGEQGNRCEQAARLGLYRLRRLILRHRRKAETQETVLGLPTGRRAIELRGFRRVLEMAWAPYVQIRSLHMWVEPTAEFLERSTGKGRARKWPAAKASALTGTSPYGFSRVQSQKVTNSIPVDRSECLVSLLVEPRAPGWDESGIRRLAEQAVEWWRAIAPKWPAAGRPEDVEGFLLRHGFAILADDLMVCLREEEEKNLRERDRLANLLEQPERIVYEEGAPRRRGQIEAEFDRLDAKVRGSGTTCRLSADGRRLLLAGDWNRFAELAREIGAALSEGAPGSDLTVAGSQEDRRDEGTGDPKPRELAGLYVRARIRAELHAAGSVGAAKTSRPTLIDLVGKHCPQALENDEEEPDRYALYDWLTALLEPHGFRTKGEATSHLMREWGVGKTLVRSLLGVIERLEEQDPEEYPLPYEKGTGRRPTLL